MHIKRTLVSISSSVNFKQQFEINLLNECTSIGIAINDDVLLAKNRDRTYIPTVTIIRELINGIEVAYMYDQDTDYAEGMNESGIGIVNTTLQGKKDENEGKTESSRRGRLSRDGFKIRKALGYDNIKDVVKTLDLYDRGIGGHTTIGCPDYFVTIEKLSFGKPNIKQHNKRQVIVRTNHGLRYPDQGYQKGKDRESSLSRSTWANKEARKAETAEELLASLRKHHKGVPGYLEPYRTNYKVWTSSQIMMNLTNLTLTFVIDENTKFLGVENRLPKNYTPKIKINVEELKMYLDTKPIINSRNDFESRKQ